MISARTKDERRARLGGYAQALNDVQDHGMGYATDTLRLLAELEYGDELEQTNVTIVIEDGAVDADKIWAVVNDQAVS